MSKGNGADLFGMGSANNFKSKERWQLLFGSRLQETEFPDCYYIMPLPRIQDILGGLQGSCYFSNPDLATGFHQMQIEEDQHLTSLITSFGLY